MNLESKYKQIESKLNRPLTVDEQAFIAQKDWDDEMLIDALEGLQNTTSNQIATATSSLNQQLRKNIHLHKKQRYQKKPLKDYNWLWVIIILVLVVIAFYVIYLINNSK